LKSISPAFTTDKIEESRDFYVEHLGAKVTFDCGWYVNLKFGQDAWTLQFMAPQKQGQLLSKPEGLIYNLEVENVDQEFKQLTSRGLKAVMPLEDHPWGDRGFAIQDPNGITLYLYSPKEPAAEFKQYYRNQPES